MNILDQLIKSFTRLPGIGKKSATRMAYFLLKSDDLYNSHLSEQIRVLKERIRNCSICGSYTEDDPCEICSDSRRDRDTICVVEQSGDIVTLESTGEFRGLYHVLGGAISPLDGIGPDDLTIQQLLKRIRQQATREVILAMNPTVEGDTTALYLVKLLQEEELTVSRLASGLPVGGDLEYADRLTLARSLRGRIEM